MEKEGVMERGEKKVLHSAFVTGMLNNNLQATRFITYTLYILNCPPEQEKYTRTVLIKQSARTVKICRYTV